MTHVNDHERRHIQQDWVLGDIPFLAMFAEPHDNWALNGYFDERADLWIVDGQPLVTSSGMALETITFTRSGGESNDRD